MGKRSLWAFTFGLYVLIAVILWAGYLIGFVPLQSAIVYTVLTPPLIGSSYALRHFAGTCLPLWRCIFILFGTFCIGGVLWVVFAIPRKLGLVDFPGYWAVTMLLALSIGAVIGDRLGKRRNYMPRCR